MESARRVLVLLVGPSSSGKTVLSRLLKDSGSFCCPRSFTTRAMRPGEENGVEYHFLSEGMYQALNQDVDIVEQFEFQGSHYGMLASELSDAFASGKTPVIVVEPNGVQTYLSKQDDLNCLCLVIGVSADNDLLNDRLNARHEELVKTGASAEKIAAHRARWENAFNDEIHWLNRDLDPDHVFRNIGDVERGGPSNEQVVAEVTVVVDITKGALEAEYNEYLQEQERAEGEVPEPEEEEEV